VEHPASHIQLPDCITVNDELTLRLLHESDAEALFQVIDRNRSDLREWLPWVDANAEAADSLAFIRTMQNQFTEKSGLTLGLLRGGAIAGIISLRGLDWLNHIGEIGYWLAKEHQGGGIMLHSCRALISHAFAKLGLHRIVIRCATGNKRSCAIPERLGFVPEGIARDGEWLNGAFVDLNVYSLLSTEWKGKA
jgi:ribosomal-protein-serine acetyltransferase